MDAERSDADVPPWRDRLHELASNKGGVANLARLAGLPVQTLRNHMARTKKPPLAHLQLIADACGIDFQWLSGVSVAPAEPKSERERHQRSGVSTAFGAEGTAPPTGFEDGAELIAYSGPSPFDEAAALPPSRGRWTVMSRALELAGFLPGDIVEFDIGSKARAGEIVIAQIYNQQRPAAETVMRLWHPPFLTVHTADPSIDPRPVEVDQAEERVKIMGAFVRMVRAARR